MKYYLLLIFFSFTHTVQSKSSLENQHAATQAFQKEAYPEAINLWSELINAPGIDRSQVFYNIGNAFFKLKKYSHAILFYEKSLKYNYNNDKATLNLKIAQAKLHFNVDSNDFFLMAWYKCFLFLLSGPFLLWSAVFFSCSALIFAIFFTISKKEIGKKISKICIGFMIFLVIWYLLQYQLIQNKSDGIIVSKNAIAYEESTLKGKSKSISEGEKVRIIDQYSHFVQIELLDNSKWWIDAQEIKMI